MAAEGGAAPAPSAKEWVAEIRGVPAAAELQRLLRTGVHGRAVVLRGALPELRGFEARKWTPQQLAARFGEAEVRCRLHRSVSLSDAPAEAECAHVTLRLREFVQWLSEPAVPAEHPLKAHPRSSNWGYLDYQHFESLITEEAARESAAAEADFAAALRCAAAGAAFLPRGAQRAAGAVARLRWGNHPWPL
eukprot:TRINITY_DN32088_c0_g1_i3.p2 TRINITY_DN32088_c0_g1~~TRINITY_DN32088_c0_g1_i3.p2  ORF type:complete len:191 (+),score=41.91 TRINITY_DN32088_c0_g1_i3:79-651(+)